MSISPEYTSIAVVGILLLGIIIGAIVARLVLPSRRQLRRLTSELESLRAQHAAYRSNVTKHFETTSELVANMTASYKAVYDHLAAGAQNLCEGSKTLEGGEFGAPRLLFDPRVDVERLDAESAIKRNESPAPASKTPTTEPSADRDENREGPVLEMTKAVMPEPSTSEEPRTSEGAVDESTRPSIH
jgi:hypothetical protein